MADVIEDVESKSQKMYQLMLVYRKLEIIYYTVRGLYVDWGNFLVLFPKQLKTEKLTIKKNKKT